MNRLLLALPLVLSTALAGADDFPLETLYHGPMNLPWTEGLETQEFANLKDLGSSGLWSQLPQPLRQQIARDDRGRYMAFNKVGAVSSPDRAVEIVSLRYEDGQLTARYRVASEPQDGAANVHLISLPSRAKVRFVREPPPPAPPTGGVVAALGGGHRLTVCHRFDCKDTVEVTLSAEALARLRSHFSPLPADATEERARVATALALIEREVGPLAGTGDDEGGWAGNIRGGQAGSQDCLDESSNTTGYLGLLVREGLLRLHRPEATVHRGFLAGHYSASMRDLATDQLWVVDTWFRDNGQPAVIQTLRDWKKKKEKNLPPLGE